MSYVYQERADGYRVVEMVMQERMIASVTTRRAVFSGTPEWKALIDARVASVPVDLQNAVRKELENIGPTFYVDLPPDEYRVHSAVGQLTDGQTKELVAGIPAKS